MTAALTIWSFWQAEQKPKAPLLFLFGTAVACYFTLQNGDLGSRMVYLEGAAVKPAVSVIGAESHEHTHSEGEHHNHHEHSGTNSDQSNSH